MHKTDQKLFDRQTMREPEKKLLTGAPLKARSYTLACCYSVADAGQVKWCRNQEFLNAGTTIKHQIESPRADAEANTLLLHPAHSPAPDPAYMRL